ncbi:hypothetical protein RUM43_010533 [Polyplax serrata]|uniref:Uncharacterized protein n=1 Tax=Polyplax serrata TaxID=468196 RepID=A0AAN8P7F8_POLSC
MTRVRFEVPVSGRRLATQRAKASDNENADNEGIAQKTKERNSFGVIGRKPDSASGRYPAKFYTVRQSNRGIK